MLGKLLFAFIAIPLIEFMLLVWIADKTSVLATIALVIVTGVVGSILARAEGIKAWMRFQQAASSGRLPGEEIQNGLMIAFAAALLLTPGILTDAFGFLLLIPLSRAWMRKRIARWFAANVRVVTLQQDMGPIFRREDPNTVDAESCRRPEEGMQDTWSQPSGKGNSIAPDDSGISGRAAQGRTSDRAESCDRRPLIHWTIHDPYGSGQ